MPVERFGRSGQRDGHVGAAELSDGRLGVATTGIDDVVGTQLDCEVELLVLDVDRDHDRTTQPRILQREMPQPADAEHGDPFTGLHVGGLDRGEGGDAGAGQRGGVAGGHRVGDRHDVALVSDGVLRVCAVDRVAAVLLGLAQRLAAGDAVAAAAAGRPEPGDGNPVSGLPNTGAGAELLHDADAFVPGDERRLWGDRPVPVRRVDVGVTDPLVFMRTSTCPGRGSGTARSRISRGAPSAGTTAAFMVFISCLPSAWGLLGGLG